MTKPSLNYYIEGSDPDNRRSSTKSLDSDGSGDTFYSAKESESPVAATDNNNNNNATSIGSTHPTFSSNDNGNDNDVELEKNAYKKNNSVNATHGRNNNHNKSTNKRFGTPLGDRTNIKNRKCIRLKSKCETTSTSGDCRPRGNIKRKQLPSSASASASCRTISTQPENPVIASNLSSYMLGPSDNIDERDAEDPLCATEYVQDMYQHFRSKEGITSVRPLYMDNQTHINKCMRSILVDWLVEVHLKIKLVPETLYLTINLIDRYLKRQEISRSRLQLLGVTSLLIASKYEDIYPPELRNLVYICDDAYTRTEVCT
jgi:hypothetical protein